MGKKLIWKRQSRSLDPDEVVPRSHEPWAETALRGGSASLVLRAGTLLLLLLTTLLLGTTRVFAHQRGDGNDDPARGGSAPFTSTFQEAPCPFTLGAGIVAGQQVHCGYVTVPQNRDTNDGKTIRLAVAIFKAPQYLHRVDPAPVLTLEGGPGGASLILRGEAITAHNYNTVVFNHDLVLFDQRGTGYSTPSLSCPELVALEGESLVGTRQIDELAAHRCHDRLVAQGTDLDGFNTLQNAADVADLIRALGYQQMTLYGVSYGTRLALTVMHLYPEVVRAAVLDSVFPPTANLYSRNELASNGQRAFSTLFQGCEKDTRCRTNYPNLQAVFYQLVDQLNTHPISFQTIDFRTKQPHTIASFAGDDLVDWLFQSLYVTPLIPALPQTIYQIKNHDYSRLAMIYGLIGFKGNTLSRGLFYSTECGEDWPFLTPQDMANPAKNVAPHITRVVDETVQREYDVCQYWKVPSVPVVQKQSVVSAIPTLVVAGEYDPITPPVDAQEAAKSLSRSYSYLFPGQGHGELHSSECSNQIISAFEDDPGKQPDSACIAHMSGPAFQ
jgi:pimeloyl-ACP methyl ester carboxylesterase